MVSQSLKSRTARGVAWNSLGTFAGQAINFVIGVVLARILSPADYGMVGMLAIFIAVFQIFIESGFSNALIQKIDRTEVDYSTIFYFNLAISILSYCILFLTAPLIAAFYKTPQLSTLTRVISLSLIVNSLTIVQQARLSIELDFKTPAIVSLLSGIISGVVGIGLAYKGFGVWALVGQSLSAAFIRSSFLYFLHRWLPKLIFSVESLKNLFGFSSKLLVAGVVATLINNLYSLLIGKMLNVRDLGYYTRSKQFPEALSGAISNILQGVTYPVLTSLQNERERMVSVYGRLMRMTVFFVMPLLALMAVITEPLIRLLLTEKWMPIVPLIQWLCIARIITPISSLNMNILNAVGRSDLYFKVDMVKLPLTIGSLIITVPFGLHAVVIGHFVSSLVSFFINAYYPGKLFNYGAIEQIREMRYVVYSTIVMSLVTYFSMSLIKEDILKLVVGLSVGISIFCLTAVLFKVKDIYEIKDILVSRIRS